MLIPVLLFIVGLLCLIKGGDWFVDGATGIARRFHVPELLIGATVVSIGTTLPEVMVSTTSALTGHGRGLGDVYKRQVICNAALIAAITIAVRPGKVDPKSLRTPVAFFFVAAAFYAGVAYTTGSFTRPVGLILLAMFVAYIVCNVLAMKNAPAPEEEEQAEEGPFAKTAPENKETGEQEKKEEISSSRAEELCMGYFKDYAIVKADYAGETNSESMEAYNFFLHDDRGRQLFAQISKQGGKLVAFDFYEDCSAKNFDLERSKAIAEDYLAGLGYENMTAVWVNESGTQATFNFAYEQDGAVYYPDMVKVKVCETKGKVVGFDAVAFLKNHRTRAAVNTKISLGEAQAKLNKNLSVEASRLTVIPVEGKETAAYEFVCDYKGDTYFIYVDANTGNEVRILNVLNSKQGRILL